MKIYNVKTKIYVYAAVSIVLIILLLNLLFGWDIDLKAIIIFGILLFISESFSVELPRISAVSVSFAIFFSAIILFGPLNAALMSLFISLVWRDIKSGIVVEKALFNFSQYFISCYLAGLFYIWTGGKLIAKTGFVINDFPYLLIPIVISSFVFFIINTFMVSYAIAFSEELNPLQVWNVNCKWTLPNHYAQAFAGVIMAQVYALVGIIGISLLLMPLLISRQTFHVYLKLKEVYTSTVKSLVKALEAKDPYTMGHSERVAEYSVKIAQLLDLPEEQVEMIEFAALLHDIGKVGVPRRILSKPSVLSEIEYRKVVDHPLVGAYIIQQIDFLKKISPAIFHHHEHFDGKGYGGGLVGELIPISARILSVADAFDAITSVRPYRGAKSKKDGMRELMACSGSQFDQRIVRALIYTQGETPETLLHEEEYSEDGRETAVLTLNEDIDFFDKQENKENENNQDE